MRGGRSSTMQAAADIRAPFADNSHEKRPDTASDDREARTMTGIPPNAADHAGLTAMQSRFVDVDALPWEDTKFAGVKAKTLGADQVGRTGAGEVMVRPAHLFCEIFNFSLSFVATSGAVRTPTDTVAAPG